MKILYRYVGNNPINWIDPWGLEKEKSLSEKLGGLIGNLTEDYRYGNYGGPGYSGPGEPIDQMDARFEHHDYHYDARQYLQGDVEIVEDLTNLPPDPRTWDPPAKDPEHAKRYRGFALDLFQKKLKQYDEEEIKEARKRRCPL